MTQDSAPTEHQIRPFSKRNGISLTILGAIGLCISLGLFIFINGVFAIALLIFSLSVVATLLGVAKIKEPNVSVTLAQQGFQFCHRRGQLFVDWDNIQRVDVVRVTQNMQVIELPFVGIKLKKINPILDCISPRLATGLLTEQRPLLMTAATQDEDLQTMEHYLSAEFAPFVTHGERYKGVLAMFGRRCETLADNLGYHLYIPVEMLDSAPQEFVSLLRQWQQQSTAYKNMT